MQTGSLRHGCFIVGVIALIITTVALQEMGYTDCMTASPGLITNTAERESKVIIVIHITIRE